MREIEDAVRVIAEALDNDAGIADGEPGHSVLITVVTPQGTVETVSNMDPENYRHFFRFMARQTDTGSFTVEEVTEQ